MAIQMTCPCGTNLSFEDAQLGQSGPCYQCGQTLTVAPTPAPAMSPVAAAAAAMHAPAQAPFPGGPNSPAPMGGEVVSQRKEGWSWSYSRMFGIMYGPIPVGIIFVVVGGLIYLATQ